VILLNKINKNNILLLVLVIGISLFGLLAIYSASFYMAQQNYGDKFFFVKKQAVGLILGVISLLFFMHFDYHKLHKLKWIVLGGSILLLLLVFIPGIGKSNYGANRWISIGGFSIQSSEIAKFGFVVFASSYISTNYNKMKTFKGMMPVLISGGIICALVLLEPNLSVTLCIGCVMLLMLFVGGVKLKYFVIFLLLGLLLLPVLIIIEPYRLRRLVAFINPWANPLEEGFQLIQSLYSLGAGGFWGVGLFNSRQKYLFLPFAESDFILSIIGEEFGFFGILILCIVYILIIAQGIKIALNAKDAFGSYLAFGISSVIGVQMLINFAVVTGSIPPTGIPLPFISAGGTSLIVFMGAIGVVLNVDRQSRKSKI
jgi:cell division protein FtsW